MITRAYRNWAIYMAVLAVTCVLVSQALAFSASDVNRVLGVMEELSEELGDFAYDEEAADDWFEQDESYEGRITAAGYTQQSWRNAVDRMMMGFLASLDDAEIEAIFVQMQGFEDRSDFTEAQKQAMRELVADMRVKMAGWRDKGAGDAEIVRPFADRIRALVMRETED